MTARLTLLLSLPFLILALSYGIYPVEVVGEWTRFCAGLCTCVGGGLMWIAVGGEG